MISLNIIIPLLFLISCFVLRILYSYKLDNKCINLIYNFIMNSERDAAGTDKFKIKLSFGRKRAELIKKYKIRTDSKFLYMYTLR